MGIRDGASPLHKPAKTALAPLTQWKLLSPIDLASLVPFLTAGMSEHLAAPRRLDRWTVTEFARRWRVTHRALQHLLVPLSAGIFFVPPERYSAANFIGLFAAALPTVYRTRLGAFLGGMTEVMCQPIANAITARGGQLRTATTVSALLTSDGSVIGVRTATVRRSPPATSSWPPTWAAHNTYSSRPCPAIDGSGRYSTHRPPHR
ncbi:hypothetical protein [Nocardia carnea]|uniref:hypothetical protein n=1 Tax=Nocardia carnea TaxID=37328 RepID=UPI002454F6DE|nr:hypothetical protein [Nocardia carnea]